MESDFKLLKGGLGSLLGPLKYLTQDCKYQILIERLKLPSAYHLAKRYVNNPIPYTSAMDGLQQQFSQPRQLVQVELEAILY